MSCPKKMLALAGVATLISSKWVRICVDLITPRTCWSGPARSKLRIVLDNSADAAAFLEVYPFDSAFCAVSKLV
jgi:hypothetical protein